MKEIQIKITADAKGFSTALKFPDGREISKRYEWVSHGSYKATFKKDWDEEDVPEEALHLLESLSGAVLSSYMRENFH